MSVYCQFYDNKQNKISEVIVSNAFVSIPANAVSGLFYDNTYKLDGLKLTFNNPATNDFSFDFAKDYFLYVFPAGYSSILATSVCSSSLMSGVPELSQNDIDYLKNLSDNSTIDFSTIVTALNSITTALSALTNLTNLTNLSNLADLANIITAINNKDNQSKIVDELEFIFVNKLNNIRCSTIRDFDSNISTDTRVKQRTIYQNLIRLLQSFNANVNVDGSLSDLGKFLRILALATQNADSNMSTANIIKNSSFNSISENLQNIETKLEQNLPFTTIVNNDYIDNCVSATVAYNKKIENIPFN